MSFKVLDNILKFVEQHNHAMDRALNRMAIDIERLSKTRVPVDKGPLKSSGRHRKVGNLHYRTEFNKEYAGYQEFGQRRDGTHRVKNYTTPGTGKFFLKSSGDEVAERAWSYFRQEAKKIRV